MRTVNATACAWSSNRPNRPISGRLPANQPETARERSPTLPVTAFGNPEGWLPSEPAERFEPLAEPAPKGPGRFFTTGRVAVEGRTIRRRPGRHRWRPIHPRL